MGLSQANIRFIDAYLQNSEIEFADIRMEMVDHVASAVEKTMEEGKISFYDAFKAYMVIHIKQLQKSNKKFIRIADRKIHKRIVSNILSFQSLIVFPTVFLLLKSVSYYTDAITFFNFLPFIFVMGLAAVYFFGYRFKKKNRYSGLERIGLVLFLIVQGMQLLLISGIQDRIFETDINVQLFSISVFSIIASGFLQTMFSLQKEYEIRYESRIV